MQFKDENDKLCSVLTCRPSKYFIGNIVEYKLNVETLNFKAGWDKYHMLVPLLLSRG